MLHGYANFSLPPVTKLELRNEFGGWSFVTSMVDGALERGCFEYGASVPPDASGELWNEFGGWSFVTSLVDGALERGCFEHGASVPPDASGELWNEVVLSMVLECVKLTELLIFLKTITGQGQP